MGSRSISVTIVIVVITVLVPSSWGEIGSGSQSQKVRRESDKYWRDDDAGLTDHQLRQFLANSLTSSYSLGPGSDSNNRGRPAKQGYLYGDRRRVPAASDTTIGVNEIDTLDGEVTPQRTSKRNGFFYGKRNGFFYGKRSASTPANAKECTKCGPQNSGQCVMYGICCSYAFGGCFLLTDDALSCMTSSSSSRCELTGVPCGADGFGRCVTNSICCSAKEGACRVDIACSQSNFQ